VNATGIRAYSVGYPVIERADASPGYGFSPGSRLSARRTIARRASRKPPHAKSFHPAAIQSGCEHSGAPHPGVSSQLCETTAMWRICRAHCGLANADPFVETDERNSASFDAADAALAASGTGDIRARGLPRAHVVGYRVGGDLFAGPALDRTDIYRPDKHRAGARSVRNHPRPCTPEALPASQTALRGAERIKTIARSRRRGRHPRPGQEHQLAGGSAVLELAQGTPVDSLNVRAYFT